MRGSCGDREAGATLARRGGRTSASRFPAPVAQRVLLNPPGLVRSGLAEPGAPGVRRAPCLFRSFVPCPYRTTGSGDRAVLWRLGISGPLLLRQPAGIPERLSKKELHLSVETAQLVVGPSPKSVVDSGVEADQCGFALRHSRLGQGCSPLEATAPADRFVSREIRRSAPGEVGCRCRGRRAGSRPWRPFALRRAPGSASPRASRERSRPCRPRPRQSCDEPR